MKTRGVNQMDKSEREKLHKILDRVIDRNEGGKTSFFHFNGDIGGLGLFLYPGHYEDGPDGDGYTYYPERDYGNSFEEIVEALKC